MKNIVNSKIMDQSDERSIAMYCRVSTREQAEFGYSIRDQEDKIKKYLEYIEDTRGDRVVYRDEGQSAKNLKRKEFLKLMRDIKGNKVKAVIVHNMDRLTRRMKDFIELIELFEKYDVELISLKEKIETNSAMGRFLVNFIVLISQWERETISERTIRGLDRSAVEGNYSVGGIRIPYGYKKDKKRLIIDEREAEIVRWVFDKIEDRTYNPNNISFVLNKKGVKAEGWTRWTEKVIKNILKNEIYYGTFKNSRIELENHSPAIITKEQFQNVGNILKKRSRLSKHLYLFKGLLVCTSCKETLVVESAYSKGNTYLYYRCKKCRKRVSEKGVEKELFNYLSNLYAVNSRKSKLLTKETQKLKRERDALFVIDSDENEMIKMIERKIDTYIGEIAEEKEKRINEWMKLTKQMKRRVLLKSVSKIKLNL